jgi:hypothetical protein
MLKIQHIVNGTFLRHCYSRFTSMNQCAFRADRVGKYAEKAEGLVRGAGAKAKQPGLSVHDELSPIEDP